MADDPVCPMCRLRVTAGAPVLFEHGDVIHLDCHLGLLEAGTAVARLLRDRPGHRLCVVCIGSALGITPTEAQGGTTRLRALRGFETRFDQCIGCGSRRQVIRALRAPGGDVSRDSRTG
jgi:hypothetical protein